MIAARTRLTTHRKPELRGDMSVDDFKSYYWMKTELVAFARRLDLPSDGYKPELVRRIECQLRGLSDAPKLPRKQPKGPRDSERPLGRNAPVINYRSDEKTRAFFTSQIGSHFHFTYHLNQYRLARKNLTYGDLVDEWAAEHQRRKNPRYKAPIAVQGEYNQYVRDFFGDQQNKGKALRDAVAGWNRAKRASGDRRYVAQGNKGDRK